jgi:hypothetical protein
MGMQPYNNKVCEHVRDKTSEIIEAHCSLAVYHSSKAVGPSECPENDGFGAPW